MSSSSRAESSLLAHDELELVAFTHFPAIFDVADNDLAAVRTRIRALAEKERTFVRQLRRSIKGKADQRGASFPGDIKRPSERKQLFAAAVQRINRELSRREELAAREQLKANAAAALQMKVASKAKSRPASQSAHPGMTPLENRKRRWSVHRGTVGSVVKAGARAQARKDARPSA